MLKFLSLVLSGQSYAVSLIGGSGPNEGYVTVNIDGTQGFVCDDHWGIEEVIRIVFIILVKRELNV